MLQQASRVVATWFAIGWASAVVGQEQAEVRQRAAEAVVVWYPPVSLTSAHPPSLPFVPPIGGCWPAEPAAEERPLPSGGSEATEARWRRAASRDGSHLVDPLGVYPPVRLLANGTIVPWIDVVNTGACETRGAEATSALAVLRVCFATRQEPAVPSLGLGTDGPVAIFGRSTGTDDLDHSRANAVLPLRLPAAVLGTDVALEWLLDPGTLAYRVPRLHTLSPP